MLIPKDYLPSLIQEANSRIRGVNRAEKINLSLFPKIVKGTGIILGDIPSLPAGVTIECFAPKGLIGFIGDGGKIDIAATSTTPEGDGRFLLYNLIPGEYTVAGYLEGELVFLETVYVEKESVTLLLESRRFF